MSRELTYLITEENIGTSPLTIHGFLKGRGYSHAVLVSLKKNAGRDFEKWRLGQSPRYPLSRRSSFSSSGGRKDLRPYCSKTIAFSSHL